MTAGCSGDESAPADATDSPAAEQPSENEALDASATESGNPAESPEAGSASSDSEPANGLVATAPEQVIEEVVEATQPPLPKPLPAPAGAKRLSPDHDIWISVDRGEVIIDGNVSLRRGVLEMFACTRNTKEHESIISANTLAFTAHAALLRLGAKAGSPVSFEPEYAPPSGAEIEIELQWRNTDGKMQTARAQDWVRDIRTGEPMDQPWVFAGSWFAENEDTGEKYYMAEGGDFICVSNFTTATLDVPAESTQSQEGLLFEAYTERIPPLGAPVRMILRPKQAAKDAAAEE